MFGAEVLAFTRPRRGAAFSTLLRGAGTHKYGMCSVWTPDQQHRCAMRSIRGTSNLTMLA